MGGNLVDYQNVSEWIGSPGQMSADGEPIAAPEVDVSRLEKDDLTPGIPIDTLVTGGPEIASMPEADIAIPDPMPLEHQALTSVTAVPLILSDARPWRSVVTITAVGDAVQFEISHRQDFDERQVIPTGNLPFDVSLHAGRQLWMRQQTGVDQLVSFMVEPRGSGR